MECDTLDDSICEDGPCEDVRPSPFIQFRSMSDIEAYGWFNTLLDIEQMPEELFLIYNVVRWWVPHPKLAMEIGSGAGGNICMLSRLLEGDGELIGIEPELYMPFPKDIIQYIIDPIKLHHIRGLSRDASTVNEVINTLGGRKLDILFIDGDHAYESVKGDWGAYHELVNSPGVVVFHDIIGGQGGPGIFYPELLSAGYRGVLACLHRDRYGTGVILI